MRINLLKNTWVLGVVLLIFSSCNQAELKQLKDQNQELMGQKMMQDSLLNQYITSIEQFEENLRLIKEKEELIEVNSNDPELAQSQRDRINEDLVNIGRLLSENRSIIEELEQKAKNSQYRNSKLQKSIKRLSNQLEEKNTEILALTEQIQNQKLEIENLVQRNETLRIAQDTLMEKSLTQASRLRDQEEKITEQIDKITLQTELLNTAFYIAGSKKELKEKNILVGGKKLNPSFDEGDFIRIDITEINTIPVAAKKAELLTFHPDNTYEFKNEEKMISGLEITNPESFWKKSKYLVVVTN